MEFKIVGGATALFILAVLIWMICFRRSRERREASAYRHGFDWAAGELLRGRDADELAAHTESSQDFGDYTDFDRGADDAMRVWRLRRTWGCRPPEASA